MCSLRQVLLSGLGNDSCKKVSQLIVYAIGVLKLFRPSTFVAVNMHRMEGRERGGNDEQEVLRIKSFFLLLLQMNKKPATGKSTKKKTKGFLRQLVQGQL